MEYLKVNGTEYSAHFCGKQIDRDWDGRASKTVTLAMPYAQAVQLFVDGLRWGIVRREADADDAAQEQDCSGYCVAGPITDNRDGTLSIKMGSYTQLEQALRELDRVCRPGGRLIIPTYMNRTDKGTTHRVSGAIGRAGADFKREFTLESYQAFFAAAGYTDARYTLCEGRIPCAVAVLQKRKEATA